MEDYSIHHPQCSVLITLTEYSDECTVSAQHSMRQRSRWKLLWFLLFLVYQLSFGTALDDEDPIKKLKSSVLHQKSLFSPRMDYNQWKPLGRGDPLKNDPTFDYVPPVLDPVQYWMDPKKGDQQKSGEILLLGVSSKKPASPYKQSIASDRNDQASIYEQHYKSTGNFYNQQQRIGRPTYFSPSMASSLMSLANQVLDGTLFSSKSVPYTVLMPPPKENSVHYPTTPMTQKPLTSKPLSSPVTIQQSNLVYQSFDGQIESIPSISWELPSSTESLKLGPPKTFMRFQFAPQNYSNKILEASDSNQNINYVTPPPLDDSQMTFKGQVSDDNDISDSYVKIEKPQAQMDHRMPIEILNPTVRPIIFHEMETMRPPPLVQITPNHMMSSMMSFVQTTPNQMAMDVSTMEATTEIPQTTVQTLTTDPLFKHYKQPMEPLKGPLYLIIQGHSKVKTYKPAKQIDGILVQENNNEIPYNNDKKMTDYDVKHLHGYERKEDFLKKSENIARQRQARTGHLQTLKHVVKTGLGALDFNKLGVENALRRRGDGDLEETELEAGYQVIENQEEVTSEKYLKGIVEEARRLA
ncbi:hypothetical protein ABEB36_004538 [Hypothenemus hampei]|uniref:Uncharacterized protein n=1 Tax=Hypothenemus hampei TaxID=57062 RepID=A0ABD1F3L9_HYPHA